jgi:hypothetical protein
MSLFVNQEATEVLRLSRDGIWANPDIPADDAAKLVLAAIGSNIKVLVQKAVEAEREACAKLCEEGIDMWPNEYHEEWNDACEDRAKSIRARGQA